MTGFADTISAVLKGFLVFGAFLILGGCGDSRYVSSLEPAEQLSTAAIVYVSIPTDGRFGQINYVGSGYRAADVITGAFSRHAARVEVGDRVEQLEEAQASAQGLGAAYVIVPEIRHWEDRETKWSYMADRAEVKVTVHDAQSGQTLASAVISGKSSHVKFGTAPPQAVLVEPLNDYVDSLY